MDLGPIFVTKYGPNCWTCFSASSYILIGSTKKRSKKLDQKTARNSGPKNHVPERRLRGGTACKTKPAARNCDGSSKPPEPCTGEALEDEIVFGCKNGPFFRTQNYMTVVVNIHTGAIFYPDGGF